MEKQSDFQLYSIMINKDLDKDLKEKAIAEFNKRNFYRNILINYRLNLKRLFLNQMLN